MGRLDELQRRSKTLVKELADEGWTVSEASSLMMMTREEMHGLNSDVSLKMVLAAHAQNEEEVV